MESHPKEILNQAVKELLTKMDFVGQVEVDDTQPEFLMVKIESEEAGLLIGQGGENLAALQHLARALVNKKFGLEPPPRFIIDINSYRVHRLELLKEMARSWARQVIKEKQAKILEPMSAYERRVIHLALSGLKEVETESQGEGLARRVVIKPR